MSKIDFLTCKIKFEHLCMLLWMSVLIYAYLKVNYKCTEKKFFSTTSICKINVLPVSLVNFERFLNCGFFSKCKSQKQLPYNLVVVYVIISNIQKLFACHVHNVLDWKKYLFFFTESLEVWFQIQNLGRILRFQRKSKVKL